MELIDSTIVKRACRAVECLPLNSIFYSDIKKVGLSSDQVFKMQERYNSPGLYWFKNSENVENTFKWLIYIGILRREVDGQGLTAKIRLTPLGREIIQKYPSLPNQKAPMARQLKNWFFSKLFFK